MDLDVNTEFLDWMNKMYGSIKEMKGVHGKVHDYLGMILGISQEGVMKVDMRDYVPKMLKQFPIQFKEGDSVLTPATENCWRKVVEKHLPQTSVRLSTKPWHKDCFCVRGQGRIFNRPLQCYVQGY